MGPRHLHTPIPTDVFSIKLVKHKGFKLFLQIVNNMYQTLPDDCQTTLKSVGHLTHETHMPGTGSQGQARTSAYATHAFKELRVDDHMLPCRFQLPLHMRFRSHVVTGHQPQRTAVHLDDFWR